jgi:hypothetical protein
MSTQRETSASQTKTTYVYTHIPQDPLIEEKRFTSTTEHILEYQGRKLLYNYAEATNISFCSASGANYAGNMNVKGYVIRWKYGTNENGEALSEIQPVTNKKERQEISQLLWPSVNGTSRVTFD